MASLHWNMLRMGRRNQGVPPDFSIVHDQSKVVAVAQQLQFLQGIAIDNQEIGKDLDVLDHDVRDLFGLLLPVYRQCVHQ